MNEDATSTINTESGPVDSLRKALTDNFYFKTPTDWTQGLDETVFNQLRRFTDGFYYYAPTATSLNPIPMGATPVGDPNWVLTQFDAAVAVADALVRAETAADEAEAQVDSLRSEVTITTATGNITLTESSQVYQFIDPNGADRNVTLPVTTVNGLTFAIKNIASANGLIDIIDSDGLTVLWADLDSSFSITVIFDGANWRVI
jgi:hypothetical protein